MPDGKPLRRWKFQVDDDAQEVSGTARRQGNKGCDLLVVCPGENPYTLLVKVLRRPYFYAIIGIRVALPSNFQFAKSRAY
jgi:hypothetical protein